MKKTRKKATMKKLNKKGLFRIFYFFLVEFSTYFSAPKRGFFAAFKNLVGSKKLTANDVAPVLDKMREHLIAKNVAADIADKLCQSVASKLEGKVIGTFSGELDNFIIF